MLFSNLFFPSEFVKSGFPNNDRNFCGLVFDMCKPDVHPYDFPFLLNNFFIIYINFVKNDEL